MAVQPFQRRRAQRWRERSSAARDSISELGPDVGSKVNLLDTHARPKGSAESTLDAIPICDCKGAVGSPFQQPAKTSAP
jgi:hypothetical protein